MRLGCAEDESFGRCEYSPAAETERTVRLNHDVLNLVTSVIGAIELRMLTAHDVRRALVQVAAGNSSRTVTLAHNALTRALRHAEANRHVTRNVAALVDTPMGQPGRPSKALTAEQAAAVLKAAEDSRLGAYVVLCLMTGIRTEEARALRWDHVNLDARSIAVWRSVRLGGDTKTSKSRRTLGLPQAVVEALREHRVRQGRGEGGRRRTVAFGRQARARLELSRLDAAQAHPESIVPYGITWPGSRPS
jgi:integrase